MVGVTGGNQKIMQPNSAALRIHIYDRIADHGYVPSIAAVAAHFGADRQSIVDTLRRAGLGKTILLDPATDEIWMAGPFSGVPTRYVVTAGSRRWWANCVWDMLGVSAVINEPTSIEAPCIDCDEILELSVGPGDTQLPEYVAHFLLPARRWYDDIGYT